VDIFTDPQASPTGLPFKVLAAPGTLSEAEVYAQRARVCDLGYLRQPYRKDDGSLGYRCPAEPVEAYVAKGGAAADTANRVCLCNGLLSAAGLAQALAGGATEPAVLTAGLEAAEIARFAADGRDHYHAADVLAVVEKAWRSG
jgi:nitronate monooxygenase